MVRGKNIDKKQIIKMVISTLNLTKTDIEILKILISVKSGLLISEIIVNIKRSERNVRKRLNLLIEKGLLKRKIEILENKRIAYRYLIKSNKKIVEGAINNLLKKVEELNKILPKVSEKSQMV